MILFPAIDLVAGRVVRLRRGDRSQMDVYSTDPVAVARDFAARGARWVHVVDLSSAFREDAEAVEKNHRAIAAICSLGVIDVDTGGGVRDMDAVRRLVDAGAKRMAIGTALVRDPGFAEEAARLFPEHVVADVAARDGEVRVDGWRDGEGIATDTLVAHLADLGYRHETACRRGSTRTPTGTSPRWRVFPSSRRAASPLWMTFAPLRPLAQA